MKQAMELGRRLVLVALLGSVWAATALAATITITHGGTSIDMDFVPIGNSGNMADPVTNRGAVGYNYEIGKYGISTAQWATVTAGWSTWGTTDGNPWTADQPVSQIRFFQAAMFANWLTSGDPMLGAYMIVAPEVTVDREAAIATYGLTNVYIVPNYDEWYKAAYYDPASGAYYSYPTGSDIAPTGVSGGTTAFTVVAASQVAPADIDNAGGLSPFGTMGQGGNLVEFIEVDTGIATVFARGGHYAQPVSETSRTANNNGNLSTSPWTANSVAGFRVARLIPEPSAMVLLALGALGVSARRKRR